MKPSLQYSQRLGRLLYNNNRSSSLVAKQQRHHHIVEIPNNHVSAIAVRSFASARPLPEERQTERINDNSKVPIPVNSSSPSTTTTTTTTKTKSNISSPQQHNIKDNKDDVDHHPNTMKEYYEWSHDEHLLYESPSEAHYPGQETMPLTSVLHIVKPREDVPRGTWPVFRLMDENGRFRDPAYDAAFRSKSLPPATTTNYEIKKEVSQQQQQKHDLKELQKQLEKDYPFHKQEFENCLLLQESKHPYPDTNSKNTLLRAHRQMVRLREMDTIFQNAQRQGRISFYMTCRGEEAIHFGSASALDMGDTVFAQYREAGLLMWRGFTLEQFSNQCFSNDADLGKGRQMPVHYGSKALQYQTISSPLGTQIPQAVGAAYHYKLQGKPNVTICFFGDGAASTTDFHSGLNFAATLRAPVLFFCRNNGYAISTPVKDQYAGDGIISRAPGYGMAAIRVDGNDLFAVHAAVREARAYALEHSAPVLIEAMTYRLGHHSTSDDSSRYRDKNEVEEFEDRSDPVSRVEKFMMNEGWITETGTTDAKAEEKRAVLKAMGDAEKRPPPPFDELFNDVYYEMTPRLKEQKAELEAHLKRNKGKY